MKCMKKRLSVIPELAEQIMTVFEDAQRKSRKFPKDHKAKRELMNAALDMIELCQKSIWKQDKPLDPRLQTFLCGALKRVVEIHTMAKETMGDKKRAKEITKAFSLEAGRGNYKNPDVKDRDTAMALDNRRNKRFKKMGLKPRHGNKTFRGQIAGDKNVHIKTVEAAITKHSEVARLIEAEKNIPVQPISK